MKRDSLLIRMRNENKKKILKIKWNTIDNVELKIIRYKRLKELELKNYNLSNSNSPIP